MPVLGRALGASMLLHAALIGPWWLRRPAVAPPRPQTLVVELDGLVTGRQVQAAAASATKVAAAPAVPAVERTAGPPGTRARAPVPAAVPSVDPDPAIAAEPGLASLPPSPGTTAPPAARADPVPPADAAATAQGLHRSEAERAALRLYLAALQRTVQLRLRYPPESRQSGEIGTPWVRFSLSAAGDLVPGTLAVARSSGFARLDDEALAAVRACAPLAPPPRPMEVVIGVAFERAEPAPQ